MEEKPMLFLEVNFHFLFFQARTTHEVYNICQSDCDCKNVAMYTK